MKTVNTKTIILSYLSVFILLCIAAVWWVNVWALLLLPYILVSSFVLSILGWVLYLWAKKALYKVNMKPVLFTNLYMMLGIAMLIGIVLLILA